MIRTQKEYREARKRLIAERQRLDEHRAKLAGEGLDAASIQRVLDPIESFHLQLREEVEAYEQLRNGEVGAVHNLHGLGRMLVGLRIARGMSQKALADRLGVHESAVSRDERNEYHGITVERAARVLDAMEADLMTSFTAPVLPFDETRRKKR